MKVGSRTPGADGTPTSTIRVSAGDGVYRAGSATPLEIHACLQAWLHRGRIDLDQDGQPVSGRDADRLAISKMRAYQKNQRWIAQR